MSDHFEELQNSNRILDDAEHLNDRLQEAGYLFFRGVLDAAAVERVKQDFVGILQEQGMVKPGCTEPLWTGLALEHIDDHPFYSLSSCDELMASEPIMNLMGRLFGGPVFRYRNVDIRFALPNDARHLTPPHQDHFYIRQTDRFRTVWTPLISIGEGAGALAIAKGSHRRGLRDHVEHESAYSYIYRGRKQRGIPMGEIDDVWLTTAYEPGDLLIFHSMTIHRALPNRSERIRLSLDARYQPQSIPRTWQSEKTILELRQYRRAIHSLAMEQGASEAAFEALVIEMMKRGAEPDASQVSALLAELKTCDAAASA